MRHMDVKMLRPEFDFELCNYLLAFYDRRTAIRAYIAFRMLREIVRKFLELKREAQQACHGPVDVILDAVRELDERSAELIEYVLTLLSR